MNDNHGYDDAGSGNESFDAESSHAEDFDAESLGVESFGIEDFDAENFEASADDALEESLRQAAAILDPVPAELRDMAVEAYALHSLRELDAELAELTFDSLVDAIPVRGADVPRMLTFSTAALTVDVEVTGRGVMGQVLPPQPARIEVLGGSPTSSATTVTADEMGRFVCDLLLTGPFALRLRTDEEVVVTEWLRV